MTTTGSASSSVTVACWRKTRHVCVLSAVIIILLSLAPHDVDAVRERITATWGPWTPWSKCSRNCGESVKIRWRKCLLPNHRYTPGVHSDISQVVVPDCVGDAEDYRTCRNAPCSPQYSDFRSAQCASFNNAFANLRWKPKIDDENECELKCQRENSSLVQSFGSAVDGTPCGAKGISMCVEGLCIPVLCDCDYSSRKPGMKFIRSFRCPTRKRKYVKYGDVSYLNDPSANPNRGQVKRYKHVVTVPRGATRIEIVDDSPNSIVLSGCGNSEYTFTSPDIKEYCGTTFIFNRSSEGDRKTLNALGPTHGDIDVRGHLRDVMTNKGVYYKFCAPPDEQTNYTRINNVIPGSDNFPEYKKNANSTTSVKKPAITRRSGKECSCSQSLRIEKRNRRKYFCRSDVVIYGNILGRDIVDGDIRYHVQIFEKYKGKELLRSREHVWSDGPCLCPKLHSGKDYVLPLKWIRDRLVLSDRIAWIHNSHTMKKILAINRKQHTLCQKYMRTNT